MTHRSLSASLGNPRAAWQAEDGRRRSIHDGCNMMRICRSGPVFEMKRMETVELSEHVFWGNKGTEASQADLVEAVHIEST